MPPTRPVKVAYMPAGPGRGPRAWAGHARAGSLQCCGRCQRMWATSPGDTSSQVCPKARPASWSPGLVNGGASAGRCPPGGRGGQASCCIRATPRDAIAVSLVPGALGGEERPVLLHVGGDEEPQGGVATAVVRPGLLPMAVSATTGEVASSICIELVGWPDNPAG